MEAQPHGSLAPLRAVLTLCLVALAFVCGWTIGHDQPDDSDAEFPTMATPQEMVEFQALTDSREETAFDDEPAEANDPQGPRPRERVKLHGAAALSETTQDIWAGSAS